MGGFGVKAYQRVSVDTGVGVSDPHTLVSMLFDGALEALKQAQGHMAAGRVLEKGQALGKAARIVEEGLKASLDRRAGGALAQQLASLYDYATMRLLQANLRNDSKALAEVTGLLGDLRDAWARIGGSAAAATVPEAPDAKAPGRRLNATV
ncbi:MAG TPA: flagellar export chaperone FliS [Burkholderiaceae bacterium]|nr:flagellar export chaperone FliS [Burkholderiaceae bacterium]